MTDYISREYVLKCMEDSFKNAGISAEAKAKMTKWLNKAPAADVRPVVRSEWKIHHKTNIAVCKCCSYQYMMGAPWHEYPPRFCPNCGARMLPEPPKEE